MQGSFQLLIDLEECALPWINKPFATLAKDVSLQQAEFMFQLIDELLLRLDRFRLLARGRRGLFELCLQLIDRCLLRLDQRPASFHIRRDRIGVECHP